MDDYKCRVCGECKNFYMWYDKGDWEHFGCDLTHTEIDDPANEACECFTDGDAYV